jgi:hypothetical protein
MGNVKKKIAVLNLHSLFLIHKIRKNMGNDAPEMKELG